jgi:DNA-binding response OmpR family regulator
MSHKILVVDDEQALRGILCRKFELEGFTTYHAGNGNDGLKMALKLHPDMILLDVIMPVCDGITMLQNLRQDSWGTTAKVILLTNLADEAKVAKCLELGVFDYLVKADWRLDDLLIKVKERLGMNS